MCRVESWINIIIHIDEFTGFQAVAVASAFSDRLCIASDGKFNANMSAEQLLSCDKKSKGCDGGYLDTAWQYIGNNGLVTGGDYGSKEVSDFCKSYT